MGPTTQISALDWSQTSNSTTTTNLEPGNPYSYPTPRNPTDQHQAHQPTKPQNRQPRKQTTLYDWIKPHLPELNDTTTDNEPNVHINNNKKPAAKTRKHPRTRRHHQKPINQNIDNDHWGDPLSTMQQIFRVASKNVNTISTDDNLLQWRGVTDNMAALRINSFTIQEPNTKWNDHLTQRINRIFCQTFRQAVLSTSNSTEPTDGNYQPGGTAVTVVGPHASRMISSGQDNSGMGRWSYIELLGKRNKRIIIASVYCVRAHTTHIGSNTVATQQEQILLQQGQQHPRPRQQLFKDLTKQVKQWQTTGHEILICLDANEDTTNVNPETGYGKLLNNTGLVDLHRHQHPHTVTPATHNRGSLTIDACLGSQLFIDALVGAWMMPFGEPHMINGDHRMLGLDFDHDILFGNKIPVPDPVITRGVYSNDMPTVREFNDRVAEECEAAQLFKRTHKLFCQYTLSPADHSELKQIDQLLTQILTANDQRCKKYGPAPWSPNLRRIYLTHRYWKIKLSEARTKRDFSHALARIIDKLPESLENGKTISANLRSIRNQLREI